jgi:hypothetical protein
MRVTTGKTTAMTTGMFIAMTIAISKVPSPGHPLSTGTNAMPDLAPCTTHLYSRLFLAGGIIITRPDTLGDFFPEPPALPLVLLFDRLDGHFLLCDVGVEEDGSLGTSDGGHAGPLALVRLQRMAVAAVTVAVAVVRQDGLEGMGLAGEVALALVVDLKRTRASTQRPIAELRSVVAVESWSPAGAQAHLNSVAGAALDGRHLDELNVGRTPNDTLDTELGCEGSSASARHPPIANADGLTQSDQVSLHSRPVLRLDSEDGVTGLLD